MQFALLIVDDRVYVGNRETPALAPVLKTIEEHGDQVVFTGSVPESRDLVEMDLEKICDIEKADVLLTIGGTGLSVRDCVPDATRAVREENCPVLKKKLHDHCTEALKQGMLYRAETGVRSGTMIVNLPGTGEMVIDCLEKLYPDLVSLTEKS